MHQGRIKCTYFVTDRLMLFCLWVIQDVNYSFLFDFTPLLELTSALSMLDRNLQWMSVCW